MKGLYAERYVESRLKKLNIHNTICFHNPTLRSDSSNSIEIDFLLLTTKAIFIIESKYRSNNTITFDGLNYMEGEKCVTNPVDQLVTQEQCIRNILGADIRIPIIPFVVYSNERNIINFMNNVPASIQQSVCKIDALTNFIIDRYNNLSNESISYERLCEMRDILAKCTCQNTLPAYLKMKESYYQIKDNNKILCKHGYRIPRKKKDGNYFFICPYSDYIFRKKEERSETICEPRSLY